MCGARNENSVKLVDLKREFHRVTDDEPLIETLETLLRAPGSIVYIVDEFGGLAGVMTLEDVVETMLGLGNRGRKRFGRGSSANSRASRRPLFPETKTALKHNWAEALQDRRRDIRRVGSGSDEVHADALAVSRRVEPAAGATRSRMARRADGHGCEIARRRPCG